jgi:hypothetical protein
MSPDSGSADREIEDLEVRPVGADVIESAPRRAWRWPGRAALLTPVLVVALVAAGAGYLVGSHRAASRTPPVPSPLPLPLTSLPLPAGAQPVTWTGDRCAVQVADRLQLGVQVLNRSQDTVILRRARATLPLGGLRPVASTWGACAQLEPQVADPLTLPAGTTTWLTITFDVPSCPSPYPVFFTVDYTEAGRGGTADLRGFNDLGGVAYTGARCPSGG